MANNKSKPHIVYKNVVKYLSNIGESIYVLENVLGVSKGTIGNWKRRGIPSLYWVDIAEYLRINTNKLTSEPESEAGKADIPPYCKICRKCMKRDYRKGPLHFDDLGCICLDVLLFFSKNKCQHLKKDKCTYDFT